MYVSNLQIYEIFLGIVYWMVRTVQPEISGVWSVWPSAIIKRNGTAIVFFCFFVMIFGSVLSTIFSLLIQQIMMLKIVFWHMSQIAVNWKSKYDFGNLDRAYSSYRIRIKILSTCYKRSASAYIIVFFLKPAKKIALFIKIAATTISM
jgi:hypothetical protein